MAKQESGTHPPHATTGKCWCGYQTGRQARLAAAAHAKVGYGR